MNILKKILLVLLGAMATMIIAVVSGTGTFLLSVGSVPGMYGLEVGLLLMFIFLLALVGGFIVGIIAFSLSHFVIFKDRSPIIALLIAALCGFIMVPAALYIGLSFSAAM